MKCSQEKEYAKEIITKNNRENFNVENLPQSEKRKNHGTFVGVHPNIHYNNLGTKPNSKQGDPKTKKSSKYSE